MNTGLSTILISGVASQVGKTTVLQALKSYWHQYRSEQTVSCLTVPGMKSATPETEHNLAELWQSLSQHQFDHDRVMLEGAGSLGTPVTFDTTVAALARDWRLPTLLVAPVEWNAIAPTVAAVALARQTCVDLIGIILNHCPLSPISQRSASKAGSVTQEDADSHAFSADSPTRNAPEINDDEMIDLLRSLIQVPIIGVMPFLENPHDGHSLAQAASNLAIERLL